MEIIHWKLSDELEEETHEHYRSDIVASLKNKNPMDIVHRITFDNIAPSITVLDVEKFVDFVNTNFLGGKIKGIGLDIGAGCGFFSALLAKRDTVQKIYAVEVTETIVQGLMPKVVEHVLGKDKSEKVIGCIGDFGNIELPDNSVDFAFDFYSLHHSHDMKHTATEIARVLKPGGFLFCFDKVRDDSLTDADLDALLDKEYDENTKRMFGVDVTKKLTRRMNGEKEFRLRDWKEAFLSGGFSHFEHYNVVRCASNNALIKKAKELFSHISPHLQTKVTNLIPDSAKAVNKLSVENRVYTRLIDPYPKEISLVIMHK